MMRKFFILLGMLLIFSACAESKDIRFVQVAEALYSPSNSKALQQCVEDINTLKNVDFVVFTGDNISSAKKENLRGFLKVVKGLKPKTYIVIGDRDVSKEKGLNKDAYREECFKYLGFGQSLSSNYVFKKKGVVFIVVDGAKEFVTATNGYYKQDTLDWLENKLTRYAKKKVVILQHFPLQDCSESQKNTYKSQLYKDLLLEYDNILAIVSGHFGSNSEQVFEDKMHIITPSYSSGKIYKVFDIPMSKDCVYTQLRRVE